MKKLQRTAVGMAVLMFVTTACTAGTDGPEVDVLPAMSDEAAEQIVQAYADEALRSSGWSGFNGGSLSPAPCTGRRGEVSEEIYAIQGAFQLLVPGPDQQSVVDRVRDGWRALGYTIVSERTFGPDDGGQVRATNPADNASLALSSAEIPAMLLLIHSGCYRRNSTATRST